MNLRRGLDEVFPFILQDRNALVAVLGGYFDESERGEGNEPIAVCGYLFKPAGYAKFRRQWQRTVLQRGRFTHFHMTDLCSGHQEYKGLSIPARVEILDAAVAAITAHAYAAIGVYFDRAEFKAVAPVEWADHFGSIYAAACQWCLQATGHWLTKWQCPMRVLYVFESGHKFRAQVNTLLTAISLDQSAIKVFRYRNHLFEDKKTEYGLQAADLLAWSTTKASVGNVTAGLRPFIPAVVRLTAAAKDRTAMYPLTGARLTAWMIDQMKGIQTPERAIRVNFGPRKRTLT